MGGHSQQIRSRVGGRGRHRALRGRGVAVRARRRVRVVPDLQQRTLALRTAPRSDRSRLPFHVRRPDARSKDAAVGSQPTIKLGRLKCSSPGKSRVDAVARSRGALRLSCRRGICRGICKRRRIRSIRNPDPFEPSGSHQRRRRAGRGARTTDRAASPGNAVAQRPRRHGRLPHRYGGTHHARGADRAGGGAERISRGLEWPWPRPAARFARHHQSSDRRTGAAGLADDALDLRDAHAYGGIGQHAGDERERPVDLRDRRAMQYRDRVQALLPDDDRRLLERAARIRARRPRRRPTTASSRTPRAARRPISP